jgi:serine/threonine protein phosphatase 1
MKAIWRLFMKLVEQNIFFRVNIEVMRRSFAIGDIHGCSKTFRKLLIEELGIRKTDEIYCVGDYIDRGPDSKGVIDLILFLRNEGYAIHTIRGNHEQMMLDTFTGKALLDNWLANGGGATLKSFGIDSLTKLSPEYINFLNQTEYFFNTPHYILVHAGLNFKCLDPFQDKDAMLWIRDGEIDNKKLNGKIIIHGHTAKPYDFIMSQLQQSEITSINIDGGCVYNYMPGMGNLFAFNFTDKKLIAVKNVD